MDSVSIARDFPPDSELVRLVERMGVPTQQVSPADLTSMARSPNHQGVAAKVGAFPYLDIEDLPLLDSASGPVVALDEVQDPGNLGAILRTAECLGASAVILTRDRCSPMTAAVEKASAGASAHVPVVRVVNLARALGQLKEFGYWLYAADAAGPDDIWSADLTGGIAFVLGSEGTGLRRLVRERCDFGVSIPMVGRIESLNVAQTAAILLAEALRRQKAAEGN